MESLRGIPTAALHGLREVLQTSDGAYRLVELTALFFTYATPHTGMAGRSEQYKDLSSATAIVVHLVENGSKWLAGEPISLTSLVSNLALDSLSVLFLVQEFQGKAVDDTVFWLRGALIATCLTDSPWNDLTSEKVADQWKAMARVSCGAITIAREVALLTLPKEHYAVLALVVITPVFKLVMDIAMSEAMMRKLGKINAE